MTKMYTEEEIRLIAQQTIGKTFKKISNMKLKTINKSKMELSPLSKFKNLKKHLQITKLSLVTFLKLMFIIMISIQNQNQTLLMQELN